MRWAFLLISGLRQVLQLTILMGKPRPCHKRHKLPLLIDVLISTVENKLWFRFLVCGLGQGLEGQGGVAWQAEGEASF